MKKIILLLVIILSGYKSDNEIRNQTIKDAKLFEFHSEIK